MYEELFSPLDIRGMRLKNRIVMPGMGTKLSENRRVTQKLIDYHAARALGGVALNIVEVSSVHAPSAPDGFLGICDDSLVCGLGKLTDAVHEAGGKVGIQLWQGGVNVLWDPNARILVPSSMSLGGNSTVPEMTVGDIDEVVVAYGQAARRAVDAGFDCVEFHAAHNYLPHTFLSAGFNKREDGYGGSLENRMRFPLEAIRSIRENIPDSMPVFMRIDAFDDGLEGGMDLDEVAEFCRRAGDEGVDVLNVSRGNTVTSAVRFEVPPLDVPKAFNIENAAVLRAKTGMLTIGAGRVNDPDIANRVVETGKVDMVCIGRGLLADPEFCNKAREGRSEDIVRCIGCNQGCYDAFCDSSQPHITCMRNPAVGREAECAIERAGVSKRVAVVGGGVGGMEAALVLSRRGHEVHLFEENDELGGQLFLAGIAPRKDEMKLAVKEMAASVLRSDVLVHLKSKVDEDVLGSVAPEVVVNAAGAAPLVPGIDGISLPFVKQANSVLVGEEHVAGNVAVIGGGLVGIETAEYLAEKGCSVTVLEMADDYGNGLGSLRRICVDEALEKNGVRIETGAEVTKIDRTGVWYRGIDGERLVSADYVVVAIGSRPRDARAIEGYCEKAGIDCVSIGDAKRARRAIDAIREAYDAARSF